MGRFIRPETTTLKISNGETLTVKKRLTSGEQRAAFARMYLAGVDGQMKVNPLTVGIAIITAYLVDWTLTDDTGASVQIRGLSVDDLTAILDNLSQEAFAEIRKAIEQHEAAMAAERDQEKNAQAGERPLSEISPSPAA